MGLCIEMGTGGISSLTTPRTRHLSFEAAGGLLKVEARAGLVVLPRTSLAVASVCALYIQGLTYWLPAVSSSAMGSLDFGTRLRCLGPVCSNPAIAKLFAFRPSLPMRIPTSILKSQDWVTSSQLSPLATV